MANGAEPRPLSGHVRDLTLRISLGILVGWAVARLRFSLVAGCVAATSWVAVAERVSGTPQYKKPSYLMNSV
jgi:hypothetical protein